MDKNDYCCMFNITNPKEAYKNRSFSLVEKYGARNDETNNLLYKWDCGERKLLKCNKCGRYVLYQSSEWHSILDDEQDLFFPVEGHDDAVHINMTINGDNLNYLEPNHPDYRPCLEYNSSEDPDFDGSWFWKNK